MPGKFWVHSIRASIVCLTLLATQSLVADDLLSSWTPVAKPYGVAADGSPLTSFQSPRFVSLDDPTTKIVVVADPVLASRFEKQAAEPTFATHLKEQNLAICFIAAPDGIAAKETSQLPKPIDAAAYSGDHVATQYLWRSLGLWAPDLVVIVQPGEQIRWDLQPAEGSFAAALRTSKVTGIGAVAAAQCAVPANTSLSEIVEQASAQINKLPTLRDSAQQELQQRRARSAVEVANQLGAYYGEALDSVNYQQALALIARIQLGEIRGDAQQLAIVQRLAEPYANGQKSALGDKPSGNTFAGHLVFAELAARTADPRYVALVQAAADHGFSADGEMREAMPTHNEMSDAVFMGTPILVWANRFTGEARYAEMAWRHLRFMLQLNVRDDGLHQHSPLDPAATAWGRGNGFPALGLAYCLSAAEPDSPYREEMLVALKKHLAAMIRYQDASGMWHQVVDRPESYPELTVTCMTTMAIARALRMGWIDEATYAPVVQRAWPAIQSRIARDGQLIDVCTGTGKQKSLRAYYDRPAILGRDTRGGAMALLVATEIALAERDGKLAID